METPLPVEPLAVVVDTVVYGAGLTRRTEPLAMRYARHLVGRRLVLSFQTVAELRYGALRAGWGERKRADMKSRLARATVVGADDTLTTAYAELRHACIQAGHALGAKEHAADRWIAVTAIHLGLPLVSDDGDFVDCPGLTLLREPAPLGASRTSQTADATRSDQ